MSQEQWVRRKAGSISGTVVPPPASDDIAPPPAQSAPPASGQSTLPRRRPGEHRPGPRASNRSRTAPQPEPPRLPDNVRSLFKPVLPDPLPAEQAVDPDPLVSPQAEVPGRDDSQRPAGGPASEEPQAPGAGGDPGRGRKQARADRRPAGATRPGRRLSWLALRPGEAGTRPPHRRQVAWLIALTVLGLLTASGTLVALVQLHGSSTGLSPNTGGIGQAAAIRTKAADWIAREIGPSSIVACDALMCSDLSTAGLPSSDLQQIGLSTPDPLAADVVVATPEVRSLYGHRLAGEYAPLVLASFGTGSAKVDVRAVAADGAAAYDTALAKDLAARKIFGTGLLGNKRITFPASARAELVAGRVDPRLLLTLPLLAHQHPIVVLGFFDQAPGAGPGVPLSGAELSASDSQATGLSAYAYHQWLVTVLLRQRPPFNAFSVTTTTRNGLKVVSVRFSRPSPLGLIHG